jgi:hypothetical protein
MLRVTNYDNTGSAPGHYFLWSNLLSRMYRVAASLSVLDAFTALMVLLLADNIARK